MPVSQLCRQLLLDEEGATAIEYSLIAALIGIAIITGLNSVNANLKVSYDKTAKVKQYVPRRVRKQVGWQEVVAHSTHFDLRSNIVGRYERPVTVSRSHRGAGEWDFGGRRT
jgi:pilus assembly protein Flp/PilA